MQVHDLQEKAAIRCLFPELPSSDNSEIWLLKQGCADHAQVGPCTTPGGAIPILQNQLQQPCLEAILTLWSVQMAKRLVRQVLGIRDVWWKGVRRE
jgi:hypothetical protein